MAVIFSLTVMIAVLVMLRWLEAEKDPRLTEIVTHLNQVVEGARIR